MAAADIEYETAEPLLAARALDVYAPTAPGPWPVVVMFHGGPGVLTKDFLAGWAQDVAAEGYVVFVPSWGLGSLEAQKVPRSTWLAAIGRQAACSVAYARSHAAEYGGDPSTLVLFGHSAGANTASVLAFLRPTPSEGCPGGAELGPISSIVTFEGDWLFMDSMWDQEIRTDPAVLSEGTPWGGLAKHADLPVVMLVSEGSGGVTDPPPGEPPVDLATARDPLTLRAALHDALTDGEGGDIGQEQAVLYTALKANGNRVSLTELPGATHNSVGLSGMPGLLAAIDQAASWGGAAGVRIESLSRDAGGDGPGLPATGGFSYAQRLVPIGPDEAWAADERGAWHYRDGRWEGPLGSGWPGVRSAVAVAPDGSVWLPTGGGVAVLRDGEWQVPWRTEARALAVGSDGSIWAATAGGLERRDARTGARTVVSGCLSPLWLEAAPDGTMYAGTLGWDPGGLYAVRGAACEKLDPLGDGGRYFVLGLDAGPGDGLLAVLADIPADGAPWRSYIVRREHGRWSVLETRTSPDASWVGALGHVAFAPDGSAWWARAEGGIVRWDGGRWETVIPDVTVNGSFTFGPDGSLWFAGPSGIQRIRAENLASE
jgi:acetyl esterase/lipase